MLAFGLLMGLLPASLWARVFAKTSRWSNQMSTMMLGVALGLTLIGAAALLGNAGDLYRGWKSSTWTQVEAVVETSRLVEVSQIRSTNPAYQAEVSYRYEVGGRTLRASRVSFGSDATADRAWVEELLATRYAPGGSLPAFVNPDDPADAVLTPGWQGRAAVFAALGVAFVAIGAWLLRGLLTDWHGDRYAERRAAPKRRRRG
jgi:hypothetical protein